MGVIELIFLQCVNEGGGITGMLDAGTDNGS